MKKQGFTLVEIMIVVAIIGLLAAIAIPNFVKARRKSQSSTCVGNLKQIESAKEQYLIDNNNVSVTALADLCGTGETAYIKGNAPQCPGTTAAYTIGNENTAASCAIGADSSYGIKPFHKLQ